LLGLVAAGERPAESDLGLCAALYLLFLARINLKDFRDRDGDRQFNKPTLLLRFGKDRTCLISLVALAAGGIILLANLRPPAAVAVILSLYLVAIGSRLHALWRADDERSEQVAIGLGARAGNGLLISVLTFLLLADSGASPADVTIMIGVVAVLFGVDFVVLVRRPEQIVIGYKA
jgi:4-hydroxybenzoate polyprenyltransferase